MAFAQRHYDEPRAIDGLRTQLRVIGALMLREMRTRFGRSQLGYLWAIAEPLGQVFVLAVIFSLLSRHPPFGSDMALFFATGVLPFQLFNSLARTLTGAFAGNEALLNIPIVQPVDTLLARSALEISTALLVMLLIFTGITLVSETAPPNDTWTLALALLGLSLNGFGIGSINAVLSKTFPSWKNVYDILSRPLLLVSGIFFVPETMPVHVREVIGYLPTVQGIEIFRDGYYSGYRSSIIDVEYFFSLGLVLCLIGLSAERFGRARNG